MMESLTESQIIREFQEFDIEVKLGSSLLDRLCEVGVKHQLDASHLCESWVAFSTQNSCPLSEEALDRLEGQLKTRKTPSSKRTVSKTAGGGAGVHVYTQDDIGTLFGDEDALIDAYATPEDKERMRGQKRPLERTTPTTPASKSRVTENGATPLTPASGRPTSNGARTPFRSPADTSFISSTPAVKFSQRQNSGNVVCSLNERSIPSTWVRGRGSVSIDFYDPENALEEPYQYMFQKVSEKAFVLIDRIEELGGAICKHNSLPEPLSVAQPSLEPAVYVGQVVCEGEGHLNARSCLLQGPTQSRRVKGHCARLEIPDNISCSLFPGQVVAVEGILNYHNTLIPSTIYDEGVFPHLPRRTASSVPGFMLVAAVGPFTTSDSLEMEPLQDLLRIVENEKPDVLLLFGPFLDATHEMIKECNLPKDQTFEEFFKSQILDPLCLSVSRSQTRLVMLPSQRDVHHPSPVYPQPPFPKTDHLKSNPLVTFASDPTTLLVNGLCFGLTSTDILFHLSARTMFRGPAGDRMTRLAGHILRQQCYYPLLPPFRKEEQHMVKEEDGDNTTPPDDPTEVNFDVIHAFDFQHAVLPVRPDVLFLPSDLKPFAKKVDGCICINPGRLARKASGGTFARIFVPHQPSMKPDFSSDIGVQILHI